MYSPYKPHSPAQWATGHLWYLFRKKSRDHHEPYTPWVPPAPGHSIYDCPRWSQVILVHGQQARGGLGIISVTGPNRATRLRGRKYLSGQLNVGHAFKKDWGPTTVRSLIDTGGNYKHTRPMSCCPTFRPVSIYSTTNGSFSMIAYC
jgi:hypothetical protein